MGRMGVGAGGKGAREFHGSGCIQVFTPRPGGHRASSFIVFRHFSLSLDFHTCHVHDIPSFSSFLIVSATFHYLHDLSCFHLAS